MRHNNLRMGAIVAGRVSYAVDDVLPFTRHRQVGRCFERGAATTQAQACARALGCLPYTARWVGAAWIPCCKNTGRELIGGGTRDTPDEDQRTTRDPWRYRQSSNLCQDFTRRSRPYITWGSTPAQRVCDRSCRRDVCGFSVPEIKR